MTKFERILKIWFYIINKDKFTLTELSNKFNVSSRTIQRDIAFLEEIGLTVYSEAGKYGGYRILNNNLLPPIIFSEEEIFSVLLTYEIMRIISDNPYGIEAELVNEKLFNQLSKKQKKNFLSLKDHINIYIPDRKTKNPFLKELIFYSLNKQEIKINYDKSIKNIQYSAIPIGLYTFNGFWYTVIYNLEIKSYKILRVDRIYEINKQQLNLDKSDLLTLSEWFKKSEDLEKNRKITLQVDIEFYRTITNPWILNAPKERENDSFELSIEYPETQEEFIVRDILKLGSHAKIQSPSRVINMIKNEISQMHKQYSE